MKWVWCDVIVQLWPVFPLTLHVFFLPGTVTKYWARRSTRVWLSSCRSWFASKSECTKRIPPRRNPSAAWSWVSERSPSTWSCTRLSVSLFLPTVKRSRPKVQSLLHQRCLQWLQSCGTLSLGKIKKSLWMQMTSCNEPVTCSMARGLTLTPCNAFWALQNQNDLETIDDFVFNLHFFHPWPDVFFFPPVAGGLDEALYNVIAMAREQEIPFVFALGRKALGRCVNKLVPVSVVGIFNYSAAEASFFCCLLLCSLRVSVTFRSTWSSVFKL